MDIGNSEFAVLVKCFFFAFSSTRDAWC